MNLIESTLKQIIEEQGLLYFRTINIADLNEQVGNIDVSQGIGVYASLPVIDFTTYNQNSSVLMEYQIEVFYLQLNQNTDDKGVDVDVILDALYTPASQLYDLIKQSGIVAAGNFIDGYSLESTDTLKMTKEVLTGWKVSMTIPIYRKDFACRVAGSFVNITDRTGNIRLNTPTNFEAFEVGNVVSVISDDNIYNDKGIILNVSAVFIEIDILFTENAGAGTYSKIV